MTLRSERLETWAEIAHHLNRDVRTAKRYEAERGMPVRRLPGGSKAHVYALRSEIDAWRQGLAPGAPPPGAAAAGDASSAPVLEPSVTPLPRRTYELRWVVAGVGATAAAIVALWLAHPASAPASTSAQVRALDQEGAYAWNRRTPQGLAQAVDAFTRAVVIDPNDASAYVGLADAYNLGPEFGGMRPADAYPRARAAALRALALAPRSAAAHRALGFVEFWWGQDVDRGLAEMREALRLDPGSSQTHHWLGNMLAVRGDPAAIRELDAAFAGRPDTATLADKGFALAVLGRYGEAQAVLRQVTRSQPDYAPAHSYLAFVDRELGDVGGDLGERRRAAELGGDTEEAQVMEAAQQAFARHGGAAAWAVVAAQEEQRLRAGDGDMFKTALAEALAHRRDAALSWLAKSRADHKPELLGAAASPDFAWLRTDPEFRRLTSPRHDPT